MNSASKLGPQPHSGSNLNPKSGLRVSSASELGSALGSGSGADPETGLRLDPGSGLRLENISVCYGNYTVLEKVSLNVAPGEVVALVGPSGCGKSTLLRAVAGLEPLAAGRVTWDGADLAAVPVHRRRFGLMFQDGQLFPHLNVAGNIDFGLRMAGIASKVRRQTVAHWLELVGLAGFESRDVSTLSGGQAQRVALARALAPQPRLLLLDEPLSSLDTDLRVELWTAVRSALARTSTAALWVTHSQEEAAAADRWLTI
ncbi:MAG: ABC transporter ATP-binding protein [Bifidobacteriaceae bacterium]|jgi:thiamine transport system ATP-binding protein|nr:ABC transporter ATP-binding protein [Bifidobacteriaceae bacterium]